jgi:hypothetical protein
LDFGESGYVVPVSRNPDKWTAWPVAGSDETVANQKDFLDQSAEKSCLAHVADAKRRTFTAETKLRILADSGVSGNPHERRQLWVSLSAGLSKLVRLLQATGLDDADG